MAQSLKGRSLLTLGDYTAEEIRLLWTRLVNIVD